MKKNIPFYKVRPISDLKDMLQQSVDVFGERPLFLIKNEKGGSYKKISFSRYGADVEAFGTALMSIGIPQPRVAIIGESRYEWYISYLATVNGNGIVVPLDKELPKGEIANLINRAHCDVVVFSHMKQEDILAIRPDIPEAKVFICMDQEEESEGILSFETLLEKGRDLVAQGDESFRNFPIDPSVMKILLFTSGTTSDSKAVMLSHYNIASNLMEMCKMVMISPEDTFLSVLPLHHTYECTCGFLCQVYRGAKVAQCEGLRYIVKNMQESQVTIMLVVPLMIESFYKKIFSKENAPKLKKAIAISNTLRKVGIDIRKKLFKRVHDTFGGHLKLLVSGGAPVDPDMLTALQNLGIHVIQGYGLTECSPILAVNRDVQYKNASAGMILPGIDVKIIDVDNNGNGEIIGKGPNIMLGYYENKEATEEAIVDGYFHTGDIGHIDEERFVFITGRKKNVIITKNGKNIFPEEIETLLMRQPYIKEVLVFGKEEEDGDTVVNAAVFPDFDLIREELGERVSEEKVRELIGSRIKEVNSLLTNYKAIRAFEIRDSEFEKTTTKKIKRAAFIPVNRKK
jgi:long-chain acyl-CoA synthetase